MSSSLPKRAVLAAGVLAAAALSACAPDLGPMKQPRTAASYAAEKSFAAPAAEWPSDTWWAVYADPQLSALIEEAVAGSPTLAQAEARVRRADYATDQARAAPGPSLDPTARAQMAKQSLNQGFPDEFKPILPKGWKFQSRLGLDLNWQLDFFGKNRALIAAATSEADAARAEAAAARLQLSTAVTAAYAELMRLYADRDSAETALKIRRASLDLVSQRQRNGLENQGAVAQAESAVPTLEGEIVAIDRNIAVTRNEIAALLGAGPDRGLAIARPAAASLHPIGLPSNLAADLMGRRADIAAARRRAEAAAERIKAAKANFYPNVDLAGFIGFQSLGADTILAKDSIAGSIGPAVTLPIFHRRTNTALYGQSQAEYDAAVASYDAAVTQALREVADALAGQRAVTSQLTSARAALASNQKAYRIAQDRYRGGLSPYLDVLTTENTMLQQQRQVADLEAQSLSLDVALVRALGGGFKDQTEGRADG